ncbi:MATE family efflux transporter [Mangrovibacterium lignilyticum]|uniref:MATE family efflux transporter n=1 Tax=Mangrovibacterium lignilyticum TaxID=2668052 RepID=UPI001967E32B|nr:MATE family efflux transporter [Mangrovibacterium lignilyticum]
MIRIFVVHRRFEMSRGKIVDMTQGPITPQIINYIVPLIIGNLCVLTYNMADSIIVGRYVGADALAALGAASPVMNIMLFLMVGICLGMSILMGHFFGAGDIPKLKREISTSLIAGGIFTLLVVAVGFFFSHAILRIMRTPAKILDDATSYLQIIFGGLVFSFIYNIYASTLRSMGNSRVSLYFLIISAVLNIVMDILFVAVWHLGIKGAAVATVIAEFLSAVFCMVYVHQKFPMLSFGRREFVFDVGLFRQTVSYSATAAMQQITLQIGKFLIQGAVNPLGVYTIGAFNAVTRIDDVIMVVQQNIGHGTTGFMAQNHGAGKADRMRKGFITGLKMVLIYTALLMVVVFAFAPNLVGAFVTDKDPQLVGPGVEYLEIMAFLYLLPGLTNLLQGYFRGVGRLKITLNATLSQMTGRVIAAYIVAQYWGLRGIALACLFGWICMLAYEMPVFIKSWRRLTALSN